MLKIINDQQISWKVKIISTSEKCGIYSENGPLGFFRSKDSEQSFCGNGLEVRPSKALHSAECLKK